jgi:hypothetical protein
VDKPNAARTTASSVLQPRRSALARRLRSGWIDEPPIDPSSDLELPRLSALALHLRARGDAPQRASLPQAPSRSGVHSMQVEQALQNQRKRDAG